MPRIARDRPTKRLSLEVTDVVWQRLEDLKERTEADSLTETIRRALAVYDLLVKVRDDGGKIFVEVDGEQKSVLLT